MKIVELLNRYKYEFIVFIAGAIEMSLELVAARIFAPYVGSTTLVWTVIIGMILIFMSLGYHIGGRAADKKHDIKSIAFYLLISGLWISFIPMLETIVLKNLSIIIESLEFTAFISSIVLFGIPCMFLAAISPYAVKMTEMQKDEKNNIGKISGRISASSTIGSIVGTFMTGFVLLPLIGAKTIILISSLILLVLDLIITDLTKIKVVIVNTVAIISAIVIYCLGLYVYAAANPALYDEVDSMYARIQVYKGITSDNKEAKFIKVGRVGAESLIMDDGKIGSYLYYFDLPKYYYKNYSKCLLVGGAGYTYPTQFYKQEENQNIKMDVVEIDPSMTDIAVREFDLDLSNPNLTNYNTDARSYINRTEEKYDAIFLDAFKGDQIPFELTTLQFLYKLKDTLNENGVVISNIISGIEGEKGKFLAHEYATYKKVFDDVKLYCIDKGRNPNERQNVVLIGFKGNIDPNDTYKYLLDEKEEFLSNYTSDETVITDDLFQLEN